MPCWVGVSLFNINELWSLLVQGTQDYKCPVTEEDSNWALSMCTLATSRTGQDATDDHFNQILRRDGLRHPANWDEAIQTYFHLLDAI